MNTKTLLLAVLAFVLLITFASAAESLPPKRTVKPAKSASIPKAPPSEYIPAQEAKKAAKKLKTPVPKSTTKNVESIPKTRDEL
ncbi:hypothetical protein BCR36DRAFT_582314 [Piromyces finnis]|uniref:Uncharacterized protein n=1 Tax=Piromyces finnis TaxID=1754191 RepID=A0A1Y1VCJ0_9FUNG|nr:hypothetical protein BCR36DRAFT_582314 [Piromyces finnis]|eukprot:ORX52906.1 hypothetical protein BCR36DRAFT_582314 [Piromyces finnis]